MCFFGLKNANSTIISWSCTFIDLFAEKDFCITKASREFFVFVLVTSCSKAMDLIVFHLTDDSDSYHC